MNTTEAIDIYIHLRPEVLEGLASLREQAQAAFHRCTEIGDREGAKRFLWLDVTTDHLLDELATWDLEPTPEHQHIEQVFES